MARLGVVIPRVAEAAGYPPAAVDRMLRTLRAAKMAPTGTRGLGKVDGAYQAADFANLLLGFAGPQTSDAAEAARLLRPLVRMCADGEPLPNPPDTLGNDLESWITGFALGLDAPSAEANELPHVLELSLNRLSAIATYSDRQDFYLIAGREPLANQSIQASPRRRGREASTHFLRADR